MVRCVRSRLCAGCVCLDTCVQHRHDLRSRLCVRQPLGDQLGMHGESDAIRQVSPAPLPHPPIPLSARYPLPPIPPLPLPSYPPVY
jgi:hypothetical protein